MRLAVATAVVLGLAPGPALALPRSRLPGADEEMKRLRPGEPGSGTPIAEALAPPDKERLQAPLPLRPRAESELEGVKIMEQSLQSYREAAAAQAQTLAHLLVVGVQHGRTTLERSFDRRIREHAAKARKLRARAVKRYEEFLRLHPDHPTWTPEIMFRLAELHFEGSSERLARQEEAYEKELEAYQERVAKEPDATAPAAPEPDFHDAIAYFRQVVERFPAFTHSDAALYMVGTLLYEQEDFEGSRRAYLALACRDRYVLPPAEGAPPPREFHAGDYRGCAPWRENSRFTDEAWLRVGEIHYDFDEFDPALEAYAAVIDDPKAELYDEALIRMAWTHYLTRDFPAAAEHLDLFVRWADEHRQEESGRGAAQLRGDAIRYLAKTYVEEDWDDDGRRDKVWGFARLERDYSQRGAERHVPEIYAALGQLFADQTDFKVAIEIWETALQRWPLAAVAPQVQLKVLQGYKALQDADGALRARDALATHYLRGTKWFYANEGDPEVVAEAMKIAEGALVATAVDHHHRAQTLRQNGDPRAAEEYAIAAKAYAAFLERFPDGNGSYEYRFHYAESLYYSGQLWPAARQYAEVRDSNVDNRLQEDAAFGAIDALERFVEAEVAAGRMQLPPMPGKDVPGPYDKENPIPEIMVELRGAYDAYVGLHPDGERTPSMMYLAGLVDQRFHHFEDSERRFVEVLDRHCKSNVGINAGKAIIDGRVVRGDLKGTQEWTEKLIGLGCGEGDESQKFAGELKTIGNAVRFQEATLLLEAGQFEAAADRYVALVDQAPDDKNADRALNNAAYAYEKIGRFGSASKTYKRIYTSYPDSELADEAIERTAFNHVRFFEFDEAVAADLVLAEDKRYAESPHREKALWNAADLLDNLQDYRKSSSLYRQYAQRAEDPDRAAEAALRSALVLAKTGDAQATIKAWEEFLKRYEGDPKRAVQVVEAHLRIGQAWASLGNRKKAQQYYGSCVRLFAERGLPVATDAADLPSEAQFLLGEYAMADYLEVRLQSTGKRLEKESKDLLERMQVAAGEYGKVYPYRRIEWVLAAIHRSAYAFETTAIKFREAPVPKQLKEFSAPWFAYKDIVEAAAQRFEAKAISFYEETLKRSREYGVSSDWTRAAQERLNVYRPEQYPLVRDPALALQIEELP